MFGRIKYIMSNINTWDAHDTNIFIGKYPKYLKGEILDILLTDQEIAQFTFEINYNEFSQQQRINLIKGFTDFYAYRTLRNIENLTDYERLILIHRMLYGPQDKKHTNKKWKYIRSLVCHAITFISYEITKYTDYLLENQVVEYIPDFYKTVNSIYSIISDNNKKIWWINYDAPRLEPYVILGKLI